MLLATSFFRSSDKVVNSYKSLKIEATDKEKIIWSGRVISVQPRIRLLRSFDERSHSYVGYVLQVHGMVKGEERTLVIGIGKGAQAKHQFRAGDSVSGKSEVVPDARTEVAEYYKTSELKMVERGPERGGYGPPWLGVPPSLLYLYFSSFSLWKQEFTDGFLCQQIRCGK